MKTTRPLAAAMQFIRLTLVRRSSSMMPIFSVRAGRPSMVSTAPNSSSVKAVSSEPCILGRTT